MNRVGVNIRHFYSKIIAQTGLDEQERFHSGKTSHPAATNLTKSLYLDNSLTFQWFVVEF